MASSSTDGDIIKDGFLLKSKDQKRKSWKQKWIVLTRGALYFYRKKTNFAPAGVFELKGVEIEIIQDTKSEKKNVFILDNKATSNRAWFSAQTEQELNEWINLLKQQLDKEPAPPPENIHAKGKGAKYAIQASVASSLLGRKLIREIVDEDSWKALDAITSFLRKTKGEEVATKFRKDLVRIGTKLVLLYNNKLIPDDAVVEMGKAVRHLSQTLVDYYQMPSIFDTVTLISVFNEIRSATEPHLDHKVSPKSMQKYRDLFAVACSEELLTNFFEKQKWSELEEIATIVRKYITNRQRL